MTRSGAPWLARPMTSARTLDPDARARPLGPNPPTADWRSAELDVCACILIVRVGRASRRGDEREERAAPPGGSSACRGTPLIVSASGAATRASRWRLVERPCGSPRCEANGSSKTIQYRRECPASASRFGRGESSRQRRGIRGLPRAAALEARHSNLAAGDVHERGSQARARAAHPRARLRSAACGAERGCSRSNERERTCARAPRPPERERARASASLRPDAGDGIAPFTAPLAAPRSGGSRAVARCVGVAGGRGARGGLDREVQRPTWSAAVVDCRRPSTARAPPPPQVDSVTVPPRRTSARRR